MNGERIIPKRDGPNVLLSSPNSGRAGPRASFGTCSHSPSAVRVCPGSLPISAPSQLAGMLKMYL